MPRNVRDWAITLVEIGLGMARRQTLSNATLIGSGAAFWLVLSIVPLLSATISLAGLLIDPYQVVDELEAMFGGLPPEFVALVDDMAATVSSSSTSLSVGLAVSVGAALWSVGTGAMYLIRAVTLAYEHEETRGYVGLRSRGLLIAAILVALILAVIVVPNVLGALTPTVSEWLIALIQALRVAVTAAVMIVAFLAFYKHATPKPVEEARAERLPGAVLATVLVMVGSQLFAFYVANFSSYATLYGAIAGVVIFMILMWLQVIFVLYGALLNAELRDRRLRGVASWPSAAATAPATALTDSTADTTGAGG